MIRVFISYDSKNDGENAITLKKELENTNSIKVEAILCPPKPDEVIENAEKIARCIDSCHVFISFYTNKGKDNSWVNQELGYAYNHVRQNGLKIICIYTNRKELRGCLDAKYVNTSNAFNLEEHGIKTVSTNIQKYLIEEYKPPIELELAVGNIFEEGAKLECILTITNNSPKNIFHGTLNFVMPHHISIEPKKNPNGRYDYILKRFTSNNKIDELLNYVSNILPKPHIKKFKIEPKEGRIRHRTFILEELYGVCAYHTTWVFEPHKTKEFDLGVYIHVPFFGTTYYGGYIRLKDNGKLKPEIGRFEPRNSDIQTIRIRTQPTPQ
ncbi:MAG: toll/interleukin-1 receptor domain-containing protein [Thermoplasmatales archaeon]|nr:toll/interleukin-1 receptor domain-containing protein [Thermoplasmatales archaeon]